MRGPGVRIPSGAPKGIRYSIPFLYALLRKSLKFTFLLQNFKIIIISYCALFHGQANIYKGELKEMN